MEQLLVAVPADCGHSRDGEHRGQWSTCRCDHNGVCETHRTEFICRLCGQRWIVVTVALLQGQMTPGWVPE